MLIFLLLTTQQAFAQPEEFPQINAQYFRPAIDSRYFVWVNESNPGKDKTLNFRNVVSYTSKPLIYTTYDDQKVEMLRSLSQMDLVADLAVDIEIIPAHRLVLAALLRRLYY